MSWAHLLVKVARQGLGIRVGSITATILCGPRPNLCLFCASEPCRKNEFSLS